MRIYLVVLCLLLLALGCHHKSTIEGTWRGTIGYSKGPAVTCTLDLKGDATYSTTIRSAGIMTETDGTYEYDEPKKTLSLTTTKILVGGKALDNKFNSVPQKIPVEWTGADKISLTLPAETWELTRG